MPFGGTGASNPLGFGGIGGALNANGAVGTGYGAGGGGGATYDTGGSKTGAAGTAGVIIIVEYA
jgi:hypothetical protein